jgi:ABC-type lipoprotein release transport system permease subunit
VRRFVAIAVVSFSAACGSSTASPPSADAVYYGGDIQVTAPAGGSIVPLAKIDEIKQVAGVKTAFPTYRFDAKTGQLSAAGVATTDLIVASDPTEAAWSSVKTSYAQGHAIDADSSGEVVLGSAIAHELNKKIGDTISLPVNPAGGAAGRSFNVVGVLDVTHTAPDRIAYVNVTDGQMLLKDSLPAAQRAQIDVTSVATAIDVYAKPGASIAELDQIADQINQHVTGVNAIKPSQLLKSLAA